MQNVRQLDGLTLPSRHSGLLHVVTVAQSGRVKNNLKGSQCRSCIHPVFNGPRKGRRDITTRWCNARAGSFSPERTFCWFSRTLSNRLPSCCSTRKYSCTSQSLFPQFNLNWICCYIARVRHHSALHVHGPSSECLT